MKSYYFWNILLWIGLIICLFLLNGCKPTLDTTNKVMSHVDLRDAIDFSSANISIPITVTLNLSNITGVAVSSPTINVAVHALENYKQPLIAKLNVELFRNQSKATWLTWALLVIVLGNFVVLVIHLRRIK